MSPKMKLISDAIVDWKKSLRYGSLPEEVVLGRRNSLTKDYIDERMQYSPGIQAAPCYNCMKGWHAEINLEKKVKPDHEKVCSKRGLKF